MSEGVGSVYKGNDGDTYNVAADVIDGWSYQRVKLIDSTEDSEAPIGVAANPLVTSVSNRVSVSIDATDASVEVRGVVTVTSPGGVNQSIAVDSSATAVQILDGLDSRKYLLLTNTDENRVYLRWGGSPTSTNWHFYLEPGERWESPIVVMTNTLEAIWSSAGTGRLVGFEGI